MCEEVARTVHISRQLGEPLAIDQAHIDSLYDRYQNVYGQLTPRPPGPTRAQLCRSTTCPTPATRSLDSTRSGSSPAASTSTARTSSSRWPRSPRRSPTPSTPPRTSRSRSSGSRSSPTPTPSAAPRWKPTRTTPCIGVTAWMHTFSPAKMWIQGLDAAAQAAAAPAHPGQRGPALGGHRLRLHEPEPGRPRRPRIRLHPVPAGRRRARPSSATSSNPEVARQVGAWQRACRRLGRRPDPEADPLRRQHAQRRRHRRRQDRGRAPLRRLGQHLVVNELADAVHGAAEADVDALVAEYERPLRRGSGAARRRSPPRLAALRRPDRTGPAQLPGSQRLRPRSPRPSRTSANSASSPGMAVQRLMADGYGFGAEGDWKTAILVRAAKVMGAGPARRRLAHGGLHLPPGARPGEDPRRPHAGGLPRP